MLNSVIFLAVFLSIHAKHGRQHTKSRLMLEKQNLNELHDWLLEQDEWIVDAINKLDNSEEVAVGNVWEPSLSRTMSESSTRHHRLSKEFHEVRPYTVDLDFLDDDEEAVGEEYNPEEDVATSCLCSGELSNGKVGAADCKSTWNGVPWCYVSKSAGCADAKPTKKLPGQMWSQNACDSQSADEEAMQSEVDTSETSQAETATGHGCFCAGVSGENNAGASDCKSTWNDIPWCYVDKSSGCSDKQTSAKKTSHDWSHEACHEVVAEALAAEESIAAKSCECAGVEGEGGVGASDCLSTWKDVPWCYVQQDSHCADKSETDKMPNYSWSHEACHRIVKEMEVEAAEFQEEQLSHDGHGQCKCAGVAGAHDAGASDCKSTWEGKSWCYVELSAGCADGKSSSKMPGYHWSTEACAGVETQTYSDVTEDTSQESSEETSEETNVAHSKASCNCVGEKVQGMGGADCKSVYGIYAEDSRPWCYVDLENGCSDSKKSKNAPDKFAWSYQACETEVAAASSGFSNGKGPEGGKPKSDSPV